MSAPSTLPVWATSPTSPIPGSSALPIVTPSAGQVEQGFVLEKPQAGVFNYLFNLIGSWITWFNSQAFGYAPIGSLQDWLGSYTNCPTLPAGWVECNGQTLSDAASPFNGQVIPNINGAASGADTFSNGKVAVFTRGGITSGVYQASQVKSHGHSASGTVTSTQGGYQLTLFSTTPAPASPPNYPLNITSGASNPLDIYEGPINNSVSVSVSASTAGSPDESRPVNMSVIKIMRVH